MKGRTIAGILLIALVAVSVGVAAEAESINIVVAPMFSVSMLRLRGMI